MPDFAQAAHSAFMKAWERKTKTDTSQYQVTSTTTQGKLKMIIIDPDEYDTVDFQYVPDNLSFNRRIDMQEVKPILRNIPKYHYSGGSTTLKFRLDFFANNESRQDVIDRCRQIEALGYSDGYDKPKQQIQLVWGTLFRNEIWEVLDVKYDLLDFKPDADFMPQQAFVDITLGLSSSINLKWSDIL